MSIGKKGLGVCGVLESGTGVMVVAEWIGRIGV